MNSLNKHAIGIIIALVQQYLLGMYTNLFIHFPESGTGDQMIDFANHQLPLLAHFILGFGLFFGLISLIIRSFLRKNKRWKVASIIAGAGCAVAIFGGLRFVYSQQEIYSFVMAAAFLVTLLGLVYGLMTGNA